MAEKNANWDVRMYCGAQLNRARNLSVDEAKEVAARGIESGYNVEVFSESVARNPRFQIDPWLWLRGALEQFDAHGNVDELIHADSPGEHIYEWLRRNWNGAA